MAHAFGRISREKAEGYDRFRFPYSEAVIHRMLDTVTPSPQAILDLGCGTGMVTRHLLGRAPVLYAVDPEPAMLGVARETMGDAPGVLFIRGFAEDTGLPDASVDLITVGNAYHRFDPEPTLREFDRILRPGGMLAVISYGDVGTPDHPGFGEAIGAVMGDFSHRIRAGSGTRHRLAAEVFFDGEPLRFSESGSVTEGWEGFWAALSWETPTPEDDWHDDYMSAIREAFHRFVPEGGNLTTRYTTEILLGRPKSSIG